MTPSLSVVMPVRNAFPYLDAAIESILDQSFSDFEFIILDDGSTDGTTERLRAWAARDPRIRLYEGKSSLGPVGSSNFVVAKARAQIVARMDGDDISHVDRLRRELKVLNGNPDAILVGTLADGIDAAGNRLRPADFSQVGSNRFVAPFAHGSIMFRRAAFERAGGYRAGCEFWEDLELYARLRHQGRMLLIPDTLYRYRFSNHGARLNSDLSRVENALDLMVRCRAALEHGEAYEHFLATDDTAERRVDPWALLLIAFLALWAGGRPRPLSRMIRRGRLRWDRRSFKALAIGAWAEISPGTIRLAARNIIALRSRKACRALGSAEVVEWSPVARSTRLRPQGEDLPDRSEIG